MKKLLILLFSLFLLSSPSVFADDISDFEIEGMSIGDSLLDYMTEEEILTEMEKSKDIYSHLKEPNKYLEVYLFKDFSSYDKISFFVKNNSTNEYVTNKNEKYTVLFIRGLIDYNEDFDSCIAKRDEVVEVLSEMFQNEDQNEYKGIHRGDPSGNSIIDGYIIGFSSGANIQAQCNNFEETWRIKNKQTEGLSVAIVSDEIAKWFTN